MKRAVFSPLLLAGLAACASEYEPQVIGGYAPTIQTDLRDCRTNAAVLVDQDRPVQSEATTGAIIGGIAGALDGSEDRAENIVAGALVGAGVGALEGLDDVDVIERAAIRSCLIERGYDVRG